MASQSRDPGLSRPLRSWELDDDMPSEAEPVDEKLTAMRLANVRRVISRLEEVGEDCHKEVPPMVLLHFPELIKQAWYEDRLVPWIPGDVKWVKYLEYMGYFYNHCVHPTLDSALDRCLEMEEKYITSSAKGWGDMSLSKAIKEGIKVMKELNVMALSEGESAVAAAALTCIAEEALLLSEVEEIEDYPVNFCDDVRRCAFKLMGYKGSKYNLVCAALLGMKKEAELMRKSLSGDIPNSDEEIETSGTVRQCTLVVIKYFEKLFVDEISDGWGTSSVDGTGSTKKKRLGVAKTKHSIQVLLKKAKSIKKLLHSQKSQAMVTSGK